VCVLILVGLVRVNAIGERGAYTQCREDSDPCRDLFPWSPHDVALLCLSLSVPLDFLSTRYSLLRNRLSSSERASISPPFAEFARDWAVVFRPLGV